MNGPDQTDPLFTIDHVLLKSKLEQGNRGSGFEGIYPLDTLHHIEFRQDIRIDPSFANLRGTARFKAVLTKYYGKDSPLTEGTP